MTSPVRVRLVESYGVLGGAQLWMLKLLDATDELDMDAVLLADGPLVDELERRGVPTRVHPTGRHGRDVVATAAWLTRDLHRNPVEVVLANCTKAGLAAVPGRWTRRAPVVWAKHDHSYDGSLARPLAHSVDRVVAAVEELATAAHRDDIAIIPPPLPDRPPADRDTARAFWRPRVDLDGAPVAVMATRLVPFKGVDDAIAAIARTSDWRLVVVGDEDPSAPGEQARLEGLSQAHGVADRVTFTGFVEGAAHWLAAFDALLVLTRVDDRGGVPEGFGTSAFEAMLAGVPVVAVKGGAVVRRLDGRAGHGVPMADPGAVADALGRLRDPDARLEAGAAARTLVADHPTAAQCADELVAELTAARDRRPGRRPTVA